MGQGLKGGIDNTDNVGIVVVMSDNAPPLRTAVLSVTRGDAHYRWRSASDGRLYRWSWMAWQVFSEGQWDDLDVPSDGCYIGPGAPTFIRVAKAI